MTKLWFPVGLTLLLALGTACAPQPTPAQRIAAKEIAALAPLKAKYPDIVTALDPSGKRLDIAIDANGYISAGDDELDAFRAAAPRAWRAAWDAAHPGEHAKLTVRLVDFIGRVWLTQHA